MLSCGLGRFEPGESFSVEMLAVDLINESFSAHGLGFSLLVGDSLGAPVGVAMIMSMNVLSLSSLASY